MRLFSIEGEAEVTEVRAAAVETAGEVEVGGDSLAPGTVEVSAIEIIARVGARQILVAEIEVASLGVLIQTGDVNSWRWTEALGEMITWAIEMPAEGGRDGSDLGWATDWAGAPPPGLEEVVVRITYYDAELNSAEHVILEHGISERSSRRLEAQHVISIEGLGRMGRYDHQRVSLSREPWHGMTHGEVIRELAKDAGIDPAAIAIGEELGRPLNKAVEIVDEEFRGLVTEIGWAAGVDVDFDRHGNLVAIPRLPEGDPEITVTSDMVARAGGITSEGDAALPTCIVIKGAAQRDGGKAGESGTIVKTRTVIVYGELEIPIALYQQDSSPSSVGALLQMSTYPSETAPPQEGIKSKVVVREVEEDGCLRERETIRYGYFAPERKRYRKDTNGDIEAYYLGWLYQEAAANDTAPQYAWSRHRFVELERTRERFEYVGGELNKKIVVYGLWRAIEEAIQDRPNTSTSWESVGFREVDTFGDGRGSKLDGEMYFGGPREPLQVGTGSIPIQLRERRARVWAQHDERQYFTSRGYVQVEELEKEAFARKGGSLYKFADGEEAGFDRETPRSIGGEVVIYEASESSGVTTITTEEDEEGSEETTVVREDGYLPEAEVCDPSLRDRSATREIEVKVCGWEDVREAWEEEIFSDWVESENHAEEVAIRELKFHSAVRVTFPVPATPAFRRGQRIQLEIGKGWQGPAFVERHEMEDVDGQRLSIITAGILQ